MSHSLPMRRAVAMLLALAAMLLGLTIASQAAGVSPARAAGNIVYNSVPEPLGTNYPSLSFQAQDTNELGDLLVLGGTDRTLDEVTFTFVSWACENGDWFEGCETTTPGSSFTHPVKLNVYAVGAGDTVGALLATTTETVTVPFRPSTDDECDTGYGPNCVNGLAFNHTFSLTSLAVTVPNQVIVSVAFDTNTSGYNPIGDPGQYDYLNVGAPNLAASVGTDPDTDVVFISADDTDEVFEAQGDWSGFGLGIRITAHTTLAATGSETDLVAAGIGSALMLMGAAALLLTARRRQVTAE